jgi:hypothetical protein
LKEQPWLKIHQMYWLRNLVVHQDLV